MSQSPVAPQDAKGQRLIAAWNNAETGEAANERHVTFLNWETLRKTLTPRRLELLRYVREHESEQLIVRQLAIALRRDYKNVHGDVSSLLEAGLLTQDEKRVLHAPWREVLTHVAI